MVRRMLVAVAVAAAALVVAPAAHAASGTSSRSWEGFVEADWAGPITPSGAEYTQRQWGAALTLDSTPGTRAVVAGGAGVCTLRFADADGSSFLGGTCTNAGLTDGVAYTFDSARLSSASVHASGLPAQTCSFDADFTQVGDCTGTTPDVDVAWTGQGVIQTDRSTDSGPGRFRTSAVSRQRSVGATGSFDGQQPAGELTRGIIFVTTFSSVLHAPKTLAASRLSTFGSVASAVSGSSQLEADSAWVGDAVADGTGTVQRESSVTVVVDTSGATPASRLFATVCDNRYDATQTFLGASCESVVADSGFTSAIDSRLRSASVHAAGLESAECTIDSSYQLIGCTTGSMSVDARWSDAGPTSRSTFVSTVPGRFRYADTLTRRTTSASGTFDGVDAGVALKAQLISESVKVVTH